MAMRCLGNPGRPARAGAVLGGDQRRMGGEGTQQPPVASLAWGRGQTGSPPAWKRKGLVLGRGPSQHLGVHGVFKARQPGTLQARLRASPRAQVCASPGRGRGARLALALPSGQSPRTPVPRRWHVRVPSKQIGLQLGWQASSAVFSASFHLGLLWCLREAPGCTQTSFPASISCLGVGWGRTSREVSLSPPALRPHLVQADVFHDP